MKVGLSVFLASMLASTLAFAEIQLPIPPKNLPFKEAEAWFKREYTSTLFHDAGLIDANKLCRFALIQMYTDHDANYVNLNIDYTDYMKDNTVKLPVSNFYNTFQVCNSIVSEWIKDNTRRGLELVEANLNETYENVDPNDWRFAVPEIECNMSIVSFYPNAGRFSPNNGLQTIAKSSQMNEMIKYCEGKVAAGNKKALDALANELAISLANGDPLPSKVNREGFETRNLKFRNTHPGFINSTASEYTRLANQIAQPAINAKIRDVIDLVLEDENALLLSAEFERVCPYKSDVNNALNGNEMSNLCKKARDSVSLNRMKYAYDRSNAESLLNEYQLFGITLPNGSFQRVNLKELIGGAAIDGLQIEIIEDKGWFSTDWTAKIYAIDALNYEGGKVVNAVLKPTKRADGVQTMQIASIDSVDDLHGPSEVIECLTTPQNMFNNVAEAQFGLGIIGTFFGVDQGADTLVNSYNTMTDSKICNEAKMTVLGSQKAS